MSALWTKCEFIMAAQMAVVGHRWLAITIVFASYKNVLFLTAPAKQKGFRQEFNPTLGKS